MHAFLLMALAGSALGLAFSAVSTYDFVAHLDRQVHGLHCSFLPGVTATDASGASGCHTTMMSPYSSVLRESLWGGIPISLWAMAVFAFLLFWGIVLIATERTSDRHATGFYVIASCVPVVASLVMGTVAVRELDAFCKLCVGIYVASGLTFVGAFATYRRAERGVASAREHGQPRAPLSYGALVLAFVLGCLFVGSSTLAYALNAPDFTRFVGSCGKLEGKTTVAQAGDALLTLDAGRAGSLLLEVIDPLCPACRAFERRLARLAVRDAARRTLLLFPLDDKCNWMVSRAVHPGACAVSEAMLCAGDDADEVLAWAFAEQDGLLADERRVPGSVERRVKAHFPRLAGCIGSSKVRARLNRSLRFAVEQKLPVLTPQVYVDGVRVCDADTDLGLDYVLSRLTGARSTR